MTSRWAVVAGAVAVTVLTVDVAWAQRRNPEPASVRRPYRGIFNQADPNAPHSLVFSASLFAAYDDNVLAGLTNRDVTHSWLQRSGHYQGVRAGLRYGFDKSSDRMGFGVHAATQVNYYRRDGASHTVPNAQVGLAYSLQLTRGLSMHARQTLSYSPTYNLMVAEGLQAVGGQDVAVEQNPDLDLFGVKALRSMSSLSLAQGIGRHFSLSGAFHYRAVEFIDEPDSQQLVDDRLRDYRTRAATAQFQYSRPLTQHAQLQLGYGIRLADERRGSGDPSAMHHIIAGVNYSRPLSISRRTSLSFSTGSSIASRDRIDDPNTDPRTIARVVGHVSLAREIGRTWTAQVGYSRGFRTRDGFDDLYLSNSVNASLGGLITRRWSFSAGVHWALSAAERSGETGARGRMSTIQTQYALASFLGVYAQYVYYSYRYDRDIPLDSRIPRRLDRQGVRVGLNTSVPLIR